MQNECQQTHERAKAMHHVVQEGAFVLVAARVGQDALHRVEKLQSFSERNEILNTLITWP